MSMTIREVINALMDSKDLDKECIIEVNKTALPKEDDNWLDIDVEQVVNCTWGSVIEGKEYEKE